MRIGILTYHRAQNYGTVLQCYALQQVLIEMGHNVEVIDYCQPYIENFYKPHLCTRRIISNLIHLNITCAKIQLFKYFNSLARQKNFSSFCKKYLNRSKPVIGNNIPKYYDCYIIGSDQLWGLYSTGGDEPIYWGMFKRKPNSKLIGYAISSNRDYSKYLSLQEIADRVRGFDALSLRELPVCEDIQTISNKKCNQCLDPTLLTTNHLWEPFLNNKYKNQKYVVTYFLREKQAVRIELLKKAKEFASSKHLEVIDLSSVKYPVEDFISIIKYATCVFTSSFHGTVFSVIFGTPFTSICHHDGHDGRYVDLLNSLGLSNHLSELGTNLKLPPFVNKQETDEKLKILRQESIQFLLNNIGSH